jgi:hypothetical protein
MGPSIGENVGNRAKISPSVETSTNPSSANTKDSPTSSVNANGFSKTKRSVPGPSMRGDWNWIVI